MATTRSRSQARARSKSPVPPVRFATAPTRTYSRSASPKRDSSVASKTPAELRSEIVECFNDPAAKKDELKVEELARQPGTDNGDVSLELGAMSLGAGVKKKFKIVLSGDGGVGKTTLANRIKGMGFTAEYVATVGADVSNILFWTSDGICHQIELWDTAGCEKIEGIGDGYFIGADGCVLVFDLLSRTTLKSLEGRYKSFKRVVPEGSVVVLGNKCDCDDSGLKIKPKQAAMWPRRVYSCYCMLVSRSSSKHISCFSKSDRKKRVPYFETSVKTGKNATAGFLSLVQTITGDRGIEFVNRPIQPPLESVVCENTAGKTKAKNAALAPLPKEDDEGL